MEPGFPCGPIHGTKADLKAAVNSFTSRSEVGFGAYNVTFTRQAVIHKTLGEKVTLCCYQHRTGNKCKFSATYEDTSGGWVLVRYSPQLDNETKKPTENHHSHPLHRSRQEAMASGIGIYVPEPLFTLASQMVGSSSIAQIDKTLAYQARVLQLPITWNYHYLRNTFGMSRHGVHLGEENILTQLDQRKKELGLSYVINSDDANCVDRIFVELQGAMRTWAIGAEENVLLFDPTWGTNAEGFKLCCFTTMSSLGSTEVLAFALLARETEDLFEWAFRCFASVFKVAPSSVFTDGDVKIRNALLSLTCSQRGMNEDNDAYVDMEPLWPKTKHFLCVYHLSQNFFKHVHPIFTGAERSKWHEAMNHFWRIAKKTDSLSCESFRSEWIMLLAHVRASTQETTAQKKALDWLETLYNRKEQWCARFVWSSCTYGIHSTQRAEAAHSALKNSFSSRQQRIVELIDQIDMYNEHSRDRKQILSQVMEKKQSLSDKHLCALISFFEDKVNPYAFTLLLGQHALAMKYKSSREVTDLEYEEAGWDEPPRFPNYMVEVRNPSPQANRQNDDYANLPMTSNGSVDWDNHCGKEDFGEESHEFVSKFVHKANLLDCSCQFPSAFGGLPCRHMIHLHIVQQTEDTDVFDTILSNVKTKFLKQNDNFWLRKEAALRQLPSVQQPCNSFFRLRGIPRNSRYSQIMHLCESIAMVGCRNSSQFEAAEGMLQNVLKTLLDKQERVDRGERHMPRIHQQATMPAESAVDAEFEDNEAEIRQTETSGTDVLSLKNVLGISSEPAKIPTQEELNSPGWREKLLHQRIAVKYNNKRSGGWEGAYVIGIRCDENYIASVDNLGPLQHDSVLDTSTPHPFEDVDHDENEYGENTVRLYFPSDKTVVFYELDLKKYTTIATASKGAWMLLKTKSLGATSAEENENFRMPDKAPKRGRPQTNRKAPIAGPMSKKSK